MASHRIYRYTSIGRPLDPAHPTNRAVLILLPLALVVGAALGWAGGADLQASLLRGLNVALAVFVSWALARELDPDDHASAFISLGAGALLALLVDSPGLLTAFVALGLVRIVNRSTGLRARTSDSVLLAAAAIGVIYATGSPSFGLVAALAFALDGSLRDPLRRQWLFALLCAGGSVVYMVDHDLGFARVSGPETLPDWLALCFLLLFALYAVLTRSVHSVGDVGGAALDLKRVRGGMALGILAALQGLDELEKVAVIVAAIAGLCLGMALRKSFEAPATG